MQQFRSFNEKLQLMNERDKLYRLLQFSCKFLAEYTKNDKYKKIFVNLSLVRRLFRFGQILNILNDYQQNPLMSKTDILVNLMCILDYICDHLVYLCKINIIRNEQLMIKADSCSDFLWTLEGITELVGHGKQLKKLELLKLLMDIFCAYGYWSGRINNGTIGIFGIISTLISMR